MSRYLVTGATGFIGGRVAGLLCEAGHAVVTLARDPARARGLAEMGVEVHRGDITDPATLEAPMQGVDGVFHIAAWYEVGVRDKSMAQRINVDGTRNVLEAMREAGYGYAAIGWAGPIDFFKKTVGATVIPDSEPGVYKNMLKG